MKLQFLGASYNHSPRSLNTVESEITGKFHGNLYKMRRLIVATSTPVRNLKYRGVVY